MSSKSSVFLSRKMKLSASNNDILALLANFAARENVEIYLVGGSVRDLLLGRESEDLDFAVTGDAFDFSRKFANFANARFVPLDKEHDTARVVFYNRTCPYMDFCGIRGADIIADLAARDFTINAMAIALSEMTKSHKPAVIDPCGGMMDLKNKLVRIASTRSFRDDPIRMLRAYRFAAALDFAIHDATTAAVQSSVSSLSSVSVERIRDELFKMLDTDNSAYHLKAMDEVGLLEQVFPEIAPMKGMEQNEYHHLDVWEHSMLTLEFLEREAPPDSLEAYFAEIDDYLRYESVKGRARMSLLKLAALLHDVGKPAVKTMDADGKIRFFDHNLEGAEIIGSVSKRLKMALRETASLKGIVENHMYPLGLSGFLRKSSGRKKKTRAMRRFLQRTGSEWLAILLLSYADLQATQGQRRQADDLGRLAQLIGDIADMYFQEFRFSAPKLITGNDLMKEFSLPASPTIGKLLQQVREAQINGTIKTKAEAMKMVKNALLRK